MPLGRGTAVAVWNDFRSGTEADIYAQLIAFDSPVPVLASLARAEATPDRVRLEWRVSGGVSEASVERTRDGSEWGRVSRATTAGLYRLSYEDTDVHPGESLGYRLSYVSNGAEARTTAVWLEIPGAALEVRARGVVTGDRIVVEVTLRSDQPGHLELVDVTGRHRRSVDLRGLHAGTHRIEIPVADIEPGIAWLRLQQAGEARVARVTISR